MGVIETVFAMIMFVNGSLDGHMMTEGLSKCLKSRPKNKNKRRQHVKYRGQG